MTREQILATANDLADYVVAVDMMDWTGWANEEIADVFALSIHILRQRAKAGPQLRALGLMLSWLTPGQRAEFSKRRQVTVIGTAGGRYRLYPQTGLTQRLELHGKRWFGMASYCLHPDHWIPPADIALAHYLNLRTDEAAFLERANEHRTQLWDGAYLRRLNAARRERSAHSQRAEQ